jgi:DNA-directed RNA polymerase specialized sigma24 family protein
MQPNDLDALVRRAAAGDEAAFAALRAALSAMTLRYFEYKTGDPTTAARLLDETFETARVALTTGQLPALPIHHWFLRHARNHVIAYYRQTHLGPGDFPAR